MALRANPFKLEEHTPGDLFACVMEMASLGLGPVLVRGDEEIDIAPERAALALSMPFDGIAYRIDHKPSDGVRAGRELPPVFTGRAYVHVEGSPEGPPERLVAALSALGYQVQRKGPKYRSRCPHHGGSMGSLWFTPFEDGACWPLCSGGCSIDSILAALGLERKDLGFAAWETIDPAPTTSGDRVPTASQSADEVVSSWRMVDLAPLLGAEISPVEPVLLARADGVKLLYPGRSHFVYGEPESGKTWVALLATAEVLMSGGAVVYIDHESEASEIVGRLLALGVTRPAIGWGRVWGGLAYIRPEVKVEDADVAWLLALVRDRRPGLVVVDGLNSALVSSGLEPNSNRDVTAFWQYLVGPLVKVSPGPVVIVDHVAKGDGSLVGAGQKRALGTGANFHCCTVSPFGRGRTGSVSLKVERDRPGALRRYANGKEIALLKLTGNPDESVSAVLEAPPMATGQDGGQFRPTGYMERVSTELFLASQGVGGRQPALSQAAIEHVIGGRHDMVRLALRMLVEEGYVTAELGARNSRLHRYVKAFSATSPDLAPTSPGANSATPTDRAQPGGVGPVGATPVGARSGAESAESEEPRPDGGAVILNLPGLENGSDV